MDAGIRLAFASLVASLVAALGCQSGPCPSIELREPGSPIRGAPVPLAMSQSEQGGLERVEWDLDFDGETDVWEWFRGREMPAKAEVDANFDGVVDLWLEFDRDGRISDARRDANEDGAPDLSVASDSIDYQSYSLPDWPRPREPPSPERCYRDPLCRLYNDHAVGLIHDAAERTVWSKVLLTYLIGPDGCPYDLQIHERSGNLAARECKDSVENAGPFPLPPPGARGWRHGLRCVS